MMAFTFPKSKKQEHHDLLEYIGRHNRYFNGSTANNSYSDTITFYTKTPQLYPIYLLFKLGLKFV